MRKLIVSVFLALCLIAPAPAFAGDGAVTFYINKERAAHGLHKVGYEKCVDRFSESRADWLYANNRFEHLGMDSLLKRCDSPYSAEILARNVTSPRHAVQAWMDSPAHREIILKPRIRRIGVGREGNIYVVNFLSRKFDK